VVCSLLWGVTGVSALVVAAHEHFHHAEVHDHHEDLEAALHGHGHEGAPDHDHEVTVPPVASRIAAAGSPHAACLQPSSPSSDQREEISLAATSVESRSIHCPPPFLMFCVLLT
jgi:hypothetical protein